MQYKKSECRRQEGNWGQGNLRCAIQLGVLLVVNKCMYCNNPKMSLVKDIERAKVEGKRTKEGI